MLLTDYVGKSLQNVTSKQILTRNAGYGIALHLFCFCFFLQETFLCKDVEAEINQIFKNFANL